MGWSRVPHGVVPTLKAAAGRYAFFQNSDLEKHVDFVELEYDSVFERWRTKVAANAAQVVGAAPVGWGRDLMNRVAGLAPTAGNAFPITHPLDVALYRLIPNVHNEVIAHLHAQIVPRLVQAGGARVSLLTHSLGTSVGHDTFAALATDKTPATNPWHAENANPNRFQLRNYITLANVSRVLQTSPKSLDSPIRPGTASQTPRYVRRFINAVHGLDPFPSIKRFNPLPEWRNESYFEIPVQHFLASNVHGYDHYLRHPRVHAAILNGLLFQPKIPESEIVRELDSTLRDEQQAALLDAGMNLTGHISRLTNMAARNAPLVEDAEESVGVRSFLEAMIEYFHT